MGCGCTRSSVIKIEKNIRLKDYYHISLKVPNSNNLLNIDIESDKESMLLYELINIACFNSKYAKELDGNFITIYNKNNDEYDYFIERLAGWKIENEKSPYLGKIWIPYINNIKEDWSLACQKNRVITKKDYVQIRYEVGLNSFKINNCND